MEAKDKADAIIDNLTLLATAYNEALTPDRIEIYTIALSDLNSEELSHGFNRALRETKWWPKPSELLEFCTGRASSMADKLAVDDAWMWVIAFIDRFGVPPEKRYELQGKVLRGATVQIALRSAIDRGEVFATSAQYYGLAIHNILPISKVIEDTLVNLAGSVNAGLLRIKAAVRSASNDPKDIAFTRKDFDEYCLRSVARNRVKGESVPKLSMSPVGPQNPRKLAIRIAFGRGISSVERLPIDEVRQLFRDGMMPADLHDEAVRHNEKTKEAEAQRAVVRRFKAIYRRPFKPTVGRATWPRLGNFTIESADGASVVEGNLPMVIGEMRLKEGDVLCFEAMPKELIFDAYKQTIFDLSKAVVKGGELHEG